MIATDCEAYILSLDAEFLRGGVILSEWCSEIVRQTDSAFVAGANLAAMLTAVAGVETYLRAEYAAQKGQRLAHLIDNSPIPPELKEDLHKLRKYRNKWVHVDEPWRDGALLEDPQALLAELDAMAQFACRALRRTMFENQWI